jgi:predicted TIM-barrel fold metal-dependent hydrolase
MPVTDAHIHVQPFPMGGVHPRSVTDAAAEVRRAASLGVRALKLHPPHMAVAPNEYLQGLDGLRALYEEAERLGLPVMIHTGTSVFPGARSRLGEPMAVDDVAVDFPRLTIVLAHGSSAASAEPVWPFRAPDGRRTYTPQVPPKPTVTWPSSTITGTWRCPLTRLNISWRSAADFFTLR